jgi:hypothetical protein
MLLQNDPYHNVTRSVFNSWRTEMSGIQGVKSGQIDWTNVSSGQIWGLVERQFDAAQVSLYARQDYWQQFNQYLESLIKSATGGL